MGIGPRLSLDIDSFKKLHNFEDEKSNSPFITFSNEFVIASLDLKIRFQVRCSNFKSKSLFSIKPLLLIPILFKPLNLPGCPSAKQKGGTSQSTLVIPPIIAK